MRSRDAIRLPACSVRFSIWRDPVRCATLHHVTAGFDRYSRRARITRATQLVMPKYRVPKDVTYDTERPARTARILVGNESLIVNDPPPLSPSPASRPIRSSRFAYESNELEIARVTLPYAGINICCYIFYYILAGYVV